MNESLEDTFGTRLKSAREAKNLTQKALGDLTQKDEAVISKWERGRNLPQKANIALLANALDVSVNWLKTGRFTNPENDQFLRQPPTENEPQRLDGDPLPTVRVQTMVTTNRLFISPWHLLDEIIQSRGMKLSDEEKVKIIMLAASKAIMERRDPIRKDVIDSLGVVFNLEEP